MKFHLTDVQIEKIRKWREEQDAIVKKQQDESGQFSDIIGPKPYYGAIGGSVSYIFTPTSIGCVVQVKHAITKAELDVTDYESL